MTTIGASLLQFLNLPRRVSLNTRSLSALTGGPIRFKPQASPTEPNTNAGKPKGCGIMRSCFSKEIADAQSKAGKQVANKTGKVSQNLNESGENLDLSEIQKASIKDFTKCWGAKNGNASYEDRYDYDNNGVIDMVDWLNFGKELQASSQEFKAAYGSETGAESYNATYDSDGNGKIDMVDWLSFGKKWTA